MLSLSDSRRRWDDPAEHMIDVTTTAAAAGIESR
jgi:hypothetical protein